MKKQSKAFKNKQRRELVKSRRAVKAPVAETVQQNPLQKLIAENIQAQINQLIGELVHLEGYKIDSVEFRNELNKRMAKALMPQLKMETKVTPEGLMQIKLSTGDIT